MADCNISGTHGPHVIIHQGVAAGYCNGVDDNDPDAWVWKK